MKYTPTHRSIQDGSDAMEVKLPGLTFALMNEAGCYWEADPAEWRAVDPEDPYGYMPEVETATYHGITKAECLTCGYVTTSVTTMEMWNDYGVTCIEGDHEAGVSRWTLQDGTVRVVVQDAEGDLETYIKEV
jgi:hypothetical protein